MVGQNIGKYRVIDRVGRGGMGTVFRAVDETLSREVAIKILNAELNDPEVARRFRAEAVTVARLNHPGIATIYELFQHDGQWMMVMEFVRGETLEHMVERLGALSPQRAADLCMQGLAALSHAHRMGVVHRDLKPANLMITESGAVKIMDFGIARVAGSEHLTSAGFLMGTPAYMAPEQVTGDEIDARTDLYAFGVVFYYLVTARLPFKGETPIAMAQSRVNSTHTPVGLVREGLPAWIEPLVDRALSKAPAERFQSADQFREALRRGLAGLPMETLSGGVVPPELVATAPPGSLSMPSSSTPSSSSMPVAAPLTSTSTSPGTLPPPPSRTATTPAPTAGLAPGVASATSGVAATKGATAATSAAAPPATTGSTAKSPTAAPPASTKAAAPINRTAIALGAAVIVLGVLVAWMWLRYRDQSVPPPATTTADASTAPATTPTPIPTPTDSPVTTPAFTIATPTPSTTPAASPGTPTPTTEPARAGAASPTPTSSPSTTPRPGTAPAPIVGTTAGTATTPTPAPSAGRSSAADAEHVAFSDVKYLTIKGQHADDEDAVLNFVAGQISVTSKKGGPALVSDPYRRIVRATYVHAKMPKWDPSLPAPMDGFDVPGIGFLRPARNWLVLQTHSDFVILRLDDSNWQQIVDTFEARTGLKVDRPPATER